ncbi:hypothetical protein [Streptomyces sp. NPDC023838]|uniref:hypothetical protein n=1 Tax=Streptomyces sp. NPDC023838 TaxID=3154325 RepID=UPI0034044299
MNSRSNVVHRPPSRRHTKLQNTGAAPLDAAHDDRPQAVVLTGGQEADVTDLLVNPVPVARAARKRDMSWAFVKFTT